MSPLSPDQIRALDGRALTRFAFDLGLAPPGSEHWDEWLYDFTQREDWEPHTNLAQADVVFRSLRARGWHTGGAADLQGGTLHADKDSRGIRTAWGHEIAWTHERTWHAVATEAHALLLCAVLAVASERETQP